MKNSRILFIDNIRIFLISLVVLHHLSITYGALGGWYYKEVEGDMLTTLILTMFTAANQSFFMGLFFLITAYFTRISLEKKPIGIFIKDRLIRLGIPLLMYYFLLSPLTIYMKLWLVNDVKYSFLEFIEKHGGFGFGPMWFVETLIYFSFIYLVYKIIRGRDHRIKTIRKFPGNLSVILTILAISTVSFAVRLWFPLGSEIPETGLQLPYFPQYIAMLVFGVLFARNGWFNSITYKQGLAWFSFAQIFILLVFPLFFILVVNDNSYAGGFTWQSSALCLWEQITGISLMIGIIGIFKKKLNTQNKMAMMLSGAAYAVYIIHPVVIVTLSGLFKSWEIYPLIKFISLAPVALLLSFLFGITLKKLPVLRKII